MSPVRGVVCPSCLLDSADETDRDTLESGLKRSFECGDCGHIWDVVF